jgi:hypothetical protein
MGPSDLSSLVFGIDSRTKVSLKPITAGQIVQPIALRKDCDGFLCIFKEQEVLGGANPFALSQNENACFRHIEGLGVRTLNSLPKSE